MTIRDLPPFRADHVGSLLRPPALLSAREDHGGGRIPAEELRAIEDDAIRQVVAMQARSACAPRPTGSSGGPPGTWTSSTGSAASAAPTSRSR